MIAKAQLDALRGDNRSSFDAWLARIKAEGCQAAGYRLTGDVLDRLCVSHLRGALRVVTAFETARSATVLLVGPHHSDPNLDVYTQLYELLGLEAPKRPRTKPSCCDGASPPPLWDEDIFALVERADELARPSRRRRRS